MPCTDHPRVAAPASLSLSLSLLLAACTAQAPAPVVVVTPPAQGSPAPSVTAPTPDATPGTRTEPPPAPAASARPSVPVLVVPPVAKRGVPLAAPTAARNWADFRLQAAQRLVQAHPEGSYTGAVREPLLAIPVLEVELHADGSVRRVLVLRHPKQARDTTQLAIDAVHRAAPYGSMTRLPPPWKWTEVFLFDDSRRFKPRQLDE